MVQLGHTACADPRPRPGTAGTPRRGRAVGGRRTPGSATPISSAARITKVPLGTESVVLSMVTVTSSVSCRCAFLWGPASDAPTHCGAASSGGVRVEGAAAVEVGPGIRSGSTAWGTDDRAEAAPSPRAQKDLPLIESATVRAASRDPPG